MAAKTTRTAKTRTTSARASKAQVEKTTPKQDDCGCGCSKTPAPETQLSETQLAKTQGDLAEMEALLLAEMKRLDDPYRLWDQRAAGPSLPNVPLDPVLPAGGK